MNKKRVLWIGLVACSTLAMFGALDSPVTVFTIGDSTMAPYDTSNNNPQRGWAQMLPQFFDNGVTVVNAARGGRSSKSFYNEGLWSAVITQVKSGDYVFIQFAHNDEKTDTAYQTDPWTSYSDYLTRYATETRAKGGIPIFFTPICRRYFGADGKITATGRHNIGPGDSAGNFPMAMRALAVRLNVPLIDLTVKTEALDEAYGAGPSADLFIPTDQTHPNILGATIIARYATLGLKEQNVFPLASHVDTASSLIVSPKSLSFGDAYINSIIQPRQISVSGFSLTPANGTVAVAAPPGFLVSAAGGTEYASLLSVPYTNGNLSTTTISVKFIPASVQLYTGAITFSLGGSQVQTLPVDGNSLRVPEGSLTAKATWALLNSQAPVDSGNIYSENQSLINLSGISYNSTFGGISGWQRAATTSYLPTLSDTSKYIEYKTAPQAGSSFLVNSVSLNVLGGGSSNGRCAVYYSLDNFVSSTPLGTAAYNSSTYAATLTSPIVLLNTSTAGLTGQQIATFSPTIVVKNGQTLSIRLFAWCTSASKYFTSKNMCISGTTSLDTVSSTSVGGTAPSAPQRPVSYRLFQNYPNPFNPVTTIRFDLPERSSIALEIFDLMGKRITVAAEGSWPAGSYSIRFNAERLSSSIYIYKLTTDRGVLFQKMLLIK